MHNYNFFLLKKNQIKLKSSYLKRNLTKINVQINYDNRGYLRFCLKQKKFGRLKFLDQILENKKGLMEFYYNIFRYVLLVI